MEELSLSEWSENQEQPRWEGEDSLLEPAGIIPCRNQRAKEVSKSRGDESKLSRDGEGQGT